MQWQRVWRVVLTGAILVGLWWWTTVSAGAGGSMQNTPLAPRLIPAGVHTPNFDACNPAAWWAFLTAELSPCTAEASQPLPASAPIRTGLARQ